MDLENIFYTYRDKVFSFFVKNLSDRELAKDLTQEIFFQLCKREDQLDDIQDINSYIFLMCRNMAINHINKAAHEKKYREHLVHAWNNLAIRGKSEIEEQINTEYYSDIIQQSLEALPPQQRLIFTLSKMDGYPIKHIAKQLDLSPNTVRNHLYQAVKTLKSTLSKSDIDFISTIISWYIILH
ncbi:RNA polymerase sigma factor [Membranihabitans marinus]|uniref:RNA polymerase sigma factor n=1 Tax=Membranihabitans marinus TaxID=1227546 RepID=UPI001EFFF72D|nr:sigma-70 family RNA polymerase sigma factor [Membranihabitans marinus]